MAQLRRALEPTVATLGDIPEFDVATAYALHEKLLGPVKSGWWNAKSLLVVAHGPLGYLPLSVLPTKPVRLAAENGLDHILIRASSLLGAVLIDRRWRRLTLFEWDPARQIVGRRK